MPLLDSYITEILRLRPPAPAMIRTVARDVEILGYYVPKGSTVLCQFRIAHYDDTVYPSSNMILMDRFVGKPKPPPVLSFGPPGSPHYCVGSALAKTMMKATFSTLLRQYLFELDPLQSRGYRFIPEMLPKSGAVVESITERDYCLALSST